MLQENFSASLAIQNALSEDSEQTVEMDMGSIWSVQSVQGLHCPLMGSLTFTTLIYEQIQQTTWYFSQKTWRHFMQIVSSGDKLHEMSNLVFWGNKEKYCNILLLKILPRVLCIKSPYHIYHIYLHAVTVVLLNPDMADLCKQCRSRSVGFWRSQLIWICAVCHSVCINLYQ